MVYAQHEVLIDLIARRLADGGDVRFGVTDTAVDGIETEQPTITLHRTRAARSRLECDFVIGADGSRTMCRFLIPRQVRTDFFRQYPFAWFGILAEAPPSSDELIYAHSERGFALVSTRSPTVQRLYFQCDPDDRTSTTGPTTGSGRSSRRGWRRRVRTVKTGNIFKKDVLQFRSRSCASRCSTGGCSWPAIPRTRCRRPGRRG